MKILYEDKKLLVVSKEAGELTIATQKEKEKTLYNEARVYVKKQYPKNKIFIVHRLDKDTSGIVILAKSEEVKRKLQNNWNSVVREYVALVEGEFKKKKGVLKSYLVEDKTLNVYETKDKRKGKLAITEYEVIKSNKKYSLLKINIKTGRKNQIRVQLSSIGHKIVGDKKYGSTDNSIKRMALHANLVMFKLDNKEYKFVDDIPKNFEKIL